MAEQEQLGPSWYHQQQRQRLEATLGQTELPARLEQLARFDTDPHGAEGLLLTLGRSGVAVASISDVEAQWQQARLRLLEALALTALELRWTAGGAPALIGAAVRAGRSAQRLSLRNASGAVVGELVLERAEGAVWSRADRSRAERLAGWLQRLIAQLPAAETGAGTSDAIDPGAQARALVTVLERLSSGAGRDADAAVPGDDLSEALELARRLAARLA